MVVIVKAKAKGGGEKLVGKRRGRGE